MFVLLSPPRQVIHGKAPYAELEKFQPWEMSLEMLENPSDFRRCYGCGPDNERGLQLSFGLDRDAQRVEAAFQPAAHMAGYRTMIHGGVTATLLDEAMGWALWGLLERLGVTHKVDVSYRRPLLVGRGYRVLGWVEAEQEKGAIVRAEVRDARDRLVAAGRGEWTFIAAERVRDA